MKRILLMLTALSYLLILTGCGELAHTHKVLTTIQQQTADLKTIQKYQKTPPSLNGLEQYAVNPESKYYFNLLKQYIKDETAIPATEDDQSSFFNAETRLDTTKQSVAKLVREGQLDMKSAMRIIKDAEENAKHPVMKMTELPEGAFSGSMTFVKGKNYQYYKTKDIYTLGISYTTSEKEAVKDRLISSFDSFLIPSGQWKKSLAGGKEIAEHNVKYAKKYVDEARELLDSAKSQNYEPPVIQERQDYLNSAEDDLKSQREKLANIKESNIMMYQYTYEKRKNKTDSYYIHINWEPSGMVVVAIGKTLTN